MNNKPGWQILMDVAKLIKDPVEREKAITSAEKMKKELKDSKSDLLGEYILSKIFDIVTIILTLASVGIVIYLFTQSIFEGFVSFVVAGILIRYLFDKRNNSQFSWFYLWF